MLSRMWNAFQRLVDNINALADSFGQANRQFRDRLALDAGEPNPPATLTDPPVKVLPPVEEPDEEKPAPKRKRAA